MLLNAERENGAKFEIECVGVREVLLATQRNESNLRHRVDEVRKGLSELIVRG